jgi:hypothetical protein
MTELIVLANSVDIEKSVWGQEKKVGCKQGKQAHLPPG